MPGAQQGMYHDVTARRFCKDFVTLDRITSGAVADGWGMAQINIQLIAVVALQRVSHGNKLRDSLQPTEVEGRAKAFSSLLYLLAS